mmetsp:Transcript_5108/g.5558  ORF Transcript_5108/g.5558 Transcript_5108/m.5558 type:complete len:146 (-) Transcript_5108:70-507(-)
MDPNANQQQYQPPPQNQYQPQPQQPPQQHYVDPYQQPPQQQYQQPPQQQPPQQANVAVNIVAPNVVHLNSNLGHNPVGMTCPRCEADIVTKTDKQMGIFMWLIVGILFFVGCWPCCLIPFCVASTKDTVHSCPSCHANLGTVSRM